MHIMKIVFKREIFINVEFSDSIRKDEILLYHVMEHFIK